MPSVWTESLAARFHHAFDLLEGAVSDCPDAQWEQSMWTVSDDESSHGQALVQRYSTPWAIAWHALERLDFLLTGGFVPWDVWPTLAQRLAEGTAVAHPAAPGVRGHTGLDVLTLSPPWTRSDVLAYTAYCRQRAVDTLIEVTDEKAATVVGNRPYAARLMQAYDHVVEHAAQIRQFLNAT